MNRRNAVIALVSTCLWLPQTASAHVGLTGLGGFWNGFLHPLMTPSHVMVLLAVAMLLGSQSQLRASRGLFAFLIATCIGLSTTGAFEAIRIPGNAMLIVAALLGLLVAWKPSIPGGLLFPLIVLCGFFLGNDSGQEAYVGKERVVVLFATGLAVFLSMLYLLALVEYLQKHTWSSVGVRITGSWIAASALIVLALSFAPVGT